MDRNRSLVSLTVTSLLLLTASPVELEARHKGDYLNVITTKLVTPHIKWGRPYARGARRVFSVVPQRVAAREVVELYQRFEFTFDAVTTAHAGLLAFSDMYNAQVEGTFADEKTARLAEKLEEAYDVIVLGNFAFDALPKVAQYKILKQVSDGFAPPLLSMGVVRQHDVGQGHRS